MRQLFPWAKRAQRRREALAEAAYLQRAEYDAAVKRLNVCPACAALVPAGEFPRHYETVHEALMNDPVC